MLTVTLYRRRDCPSCEEIHAMLDSFQQDVPHRLAEVDIDASDALLAQYGDSAPVLEAGPYRLNAPFSEKEIRMTLFAAQNRKEHLLQIDEDSYQKELQRGRSFTTSDKISYWLSRHYLAVLSLALFLYVGMPFLAPVLMKVGAKLPAKMIYTVYSPLCHQLGFRSWFLFGEQPAYPRAAAHVQGWKTFGEATGLDEEDLWAARAFRGNEQVGYKVAICERDVAIYGSMLLFALLFAATGRKLHSLHVVWWFLFGWIPIGLDGVSQILSQMQIPMLAAILPYRESTPFLRTLTGFLFGFTTAWFALPYLEEVARDSQKYFAKKIAVAKALK